MSKRRLVLVALLIFTALYPFVLSWAVQAFEFWRTAQLAMVPEEVRPYADPGFFFPSPWGRFVMILGAGIVFSWLLLAMWRKS